MIQALLNEVEALGCAVSREMDNIKLHDPRPLTDKIKQRLRKHKTEILELFERQEKAKAKGWIVYPNGESYEKQVSRNSFVYIFSEPNGSYTVWRGTWREKKSPASEKIIIRKVDFETAFQRANKYIEWFRK